METLATFTISAFVLLCLVSAASVLMRSVDRSVADVQSVDELGRALAVIGQDVAGLKRARWNGMEPQAFVFRGGTNSLFFARTSRTPGGATATQVVALREIVTDGGPRLVRSEARLAARAASFDDLHFGSQREIWTGAARLRFAYVPLRHGRDEPVQRHDWPLGKEMPAAIVIEAIDRQTRRVLVASQVTIRADADIGCVDDSESDAAADAAPQPGAAPATTPTVQGTGGVDFGDLPQQPQALPEPIAAPGAPAAQSGPGEAFCGRPDADDDKKAQAGTPQPGAPPPSAPTSAASGTMP